jgi:hypothetical protein
MLLQLDLQDLRLVRRKPVRRNAEISGKNLTLAGDDSAVALGALGTNGSPHHGRLDRCDRAEPCYFCRRLCSMVQGQETASDLGSARLRNYWRRKVQPAEFLPKSRRIAQKSSKMFG